MQVGLTRPWSLACTVQAIVLASLVPALAQPLPPESQRTVEWYTSHPSERTQVRRICLNDPGHLATLPDCINAKRGDLIAASRGDARVSDPTSGGNPDDPDSPGYWTRRPRDRALRLTYCAQMPPAAAARAYCGPARLSAQQEQRADARH